MEAVIKVHGERAAHRVNIEFIGKGDDPAVEFRPLRERLHRGPGLFPGRLHAVLASEIEVISQ